MDKFNEMIDELMKLKKLVKELERDKKRKEKTT